MVIHSSYFRGGLNRKITVPFVPESQGGGRWWEGRTDNGSHYAARSGFRLSGFPCRLVNKWFVAYGAPSFEPEIST